MLEDHNYSCTDNLAVQAIPAVQAYSWQLLYIFTLLFNSYFYHMIQVGGDLPCPCLTVCCISSTPQIVPRFQSRWWLLTTPYIGVVESWLLGIAMSSSCEGPSKRSLCLAPAGPWGDTSFHCLVCPLDCLHLLNWWTSSDSHGCVGITIFFLPIPVYV